MTLSPAPLPDPVDVKVGERIAGRRRELGLSQSDLARALSITFQQVQKYERGVNRISASKLWATARFLRVPVQALFPAQDGEPLAEVETSDLAETVASVVDTLAPADQALVLSVARRLQSERHGRKPRTQRALVDAV